MLHYTAVESEAELPFAGLQALLGPLVVHLSEIPEPQARALSAALALEASANVNRLAVYAGALSLLGVASERVPLLVVVDDAHWLDRPSAEALTFAARRLTAESLALLFAVREGEGIDLGVALPTIELEPLEVAASMELLHERFGSTIAAKVARHLAEATGGNPLALLEVAALLDEGERVGRQPLPDHLPASESVERTVRRALRNLPPEARRALLVAAASDSPTTGDLAALEPAEEAGLVRIHAGSVAFRHPLVRSAVYHAASADERRAAHRTLADALTGEEDVRPARVAARSGRRRAGRDGRRGSRSRRLPLCRARRSSVGLASTRARSRAQRGRRCVRPPAPRRRARCGARRRPRARGAACRAGLEACPRPGFASRCQGPRLASKRLARPGRRRLRLRDRGRAPRSAPPRTGGTPALREQQCSVAQARPRACAATGAEECRARSGGRRPAGRGPLGTMDGGRRDGQPLEPRLHPDAPRTANRSGGGGPRPPPGSRPSR